MAHREAVPSAPPPSRAIATIPAAPTRHAPSTTRLSRSGSTSGATSAMHERRGIEREHGECDRPVLDGLEEEQPVSALHDTEQDERSQAAVRRKEACPARDESGDTERQRGERQTPEREGLGPEVDGGDENRDEAPRGGEPTECEVPPHRAMLGDSREERLARSGHVRRRTIALGVPGGDP